MNVKIKDKQKIISSAWTFPPISWWGKLSKSDNIYFDPFEKFQKMTYHNRFLLTGSQGKQLLSIPIKGGRNQKILMKDVQIDNAQKWRSHHLKTIQTLYKRSPYFEFFENDIYELYDKRIDTLLEFNIESFVLAKDLMSLKINLLNDNDHLGDEVEFIDIRRFPSKDSTESQIKYHQVFEDNIGFQEDCSILDLLFCEGNLTKSLIGLP